MSKLKTMEETRGNHANIFPIKISPTSIVTNMIFVFFLGILHGMEKINLPFLSVRITPEEGQSIDQPKHCHNQKKKKNDIQHQKIY